MLSFNRIIIAAAFTVATCSSIICSAACDLPSQCTSDGNLFGQCINHACNDGLTCFSGLAGDVCVRAAIEDVQPEDDACAVQIGDGQVECNDTHWWACLVVCDNDAQCWGGTVCEENIGACMHPYGPYNVRAPDGAELGPCTKESTCEYHLDTCMAEKKGSMCIRKDHPEWLILCNADDECVNGQVCGTEFGFCVWPDL